MRYYRGNDAYERYNKALTKLESSEMNIIKSYSGIVLESGNLIKNCDMFLDMDLIESCFNDANLIKQNVLTEASRVDVGLLEFLEDGNDYKGLKRDLRELIDLNNDNDRKPSTMKKALRTCKRIYQAIHDYEIIGRGLAVVGSTSVIAAIKNALVKEAIEFANFGKNMNIELFQKSIGAEIAGIKAVASIATIGIIIAFVYNFIYNFVLRYTEDYDDYKEIKSEIEDNLKELKKNAKDCKDDKLKKRYETAIEKVEDRLKTIEAKRDGITRKAAGKWIDDRTYKQAIDTKSHQVNRRQTYSD